MARTAALAVARQFNGHIIVVDLSLLNGRLFNFGGWGCHGDGSEKGTDEEDRANHCCEMGDCGQGKR